MIFQESIFSIFGVKIEIIGLNFDAQESRMIKILKCNKLPINWRFPSINLSKCCLLLKIANAAVTYFEDQLYHHRIVKHSSFYIVLWFLNKSEVWKKSHLINIECGVFEFSRKKRKEKKNWNFFLARKFRRKKCCECVNWQ